MDTTEVVTALVALGGWLGVYFQARQARAAEAQLKTQVTSLTEIVARLDQERRDRQAELSAERSQRSSAIATHDSILEELTKGISGIRSTTTTTGSAQLISLQHVVLCISILIRCISDVLSAQKRAEHSELLQAATDIAEGLGESLNIACGPDGSATVASRARLQAALSKLRNGLKRCEARGLYIRGWSDEPGDPA